VADQVRYHRWIEGSAAVRDAPNGGGELPHVRHSVPEQVADTLGAVAKKIHRIRGLDILGQHKDGGVCS
jgi:hypothetical protein